MSSYDVLIIKRHSAAAGLRILTYPLRFYYRCYWRNNHADVRLNSQNVGDDADTPQIGGRCDRLVVGDLWRTELRRRVLDVQLPRRVVRAREAQVGHFQLV